MNVAVLGTGVVGQTLAGKLAEVGNDVVVGTRDVNELLARREPLMSGARPFAEWHEQHPHIGVATFNRASLDSDIVFLAVAGAVATEVLLAAGAEAVDGKIVIDVSNPLEFSDGMPPTLLVCNTDSIGEQLQRTVTGARIVKSLNTVNAALMVDPRQLADAEHGLFVSGNDPDAKHEVARLLRDWFGWKHIIDLGDISTARGVEMYLPLWLRLWGAVGTPIVNVNIVHASAPG